MSDETTGEDTAEAAVEKLRQEMVANPAAALDKLRAELKYLHTPGCTWADTILVGNCCQGNDAALLGMKHWREMDELRALVKAVLYCAFKYDDKPHQLFLAIRRLAEKYEDDPADRAEIVRLMNLAYEGAATK